MPRLRIEYLALLALLISLGAGCEVINPAEELPAYVRFVDPTVVLDENTGFETNAGIRNIWFYHGGFLQGAYQVDPEIDTNGRTIPFLQLDRSDFFIEGGVYESGQSAFQIPYPFWDRISFNQQMQAGDTLVIKPQFHYVSSNLFETPVNEHFDGGSIDLTRFSTGLQTNTKSTFFTPQNDDVFQGIGSGYVGFGPNQEFFEVINSTPFITDQSKNIFAEITYKNTIPFSVGLVYQTPEGSVQTNTILNVSPSGTWNTIYVHMITEVRSLINRHGPTTLFWLWLKADGLGNQGYIRFDDIRVIREK